MIQALAGMDFYTTVIAVDGAFLACKLWRTIWLNFIYPFFCLHLISASERASKQAGGSYVWHVLVINKLY